jgi:hypothetical protein
MSKRRPSYFWARHADWRATLSREAWEGFQYARQLADDAQLRSDNVVAHEPLLPPLTIKDVAEANGVSVRTVNRRIGLARRELYGELSDGGIYYRLRRRRVLRARPPRHCHEPGCGEELPAGASAARKYCDRHRSTAARVRRYRQRQSLAGTSAQTAHMDE